MASVSDELLSLYVEWQEALARHGDSPYAADLQYALERVLARELEVSPLDPEQLDAVLDELHRAAWPEASSRPPRLVGGDFIDPREEYGR